MKYITKEDPVRFGSISEDLKNFMVVCMFRMVSAVFQILNLRNLLPI